MNDKTWVIFDDEQGELVICTDLQDTTNGCEYNPIARIEYSDEEEFNEYMANFTEICKAHNQPNRKNNDDGND